MINWNINALFWYTFYCILSDCVHFRMPSTFWITNPKTIMRNNVAAGSDVSENKWRRKFLPFLFINAFARTLIMGFDFSIHVLYSISMPGSGMYSRMSLLELPLELSKPCRKTKQSGPRSQSSPTTSCILTAWSVSQYRVK